MPLVHACRLRSSVTTCDATRARAAYHGLVDPKYEKIQAKHGKSLFTPLPKEPRIPTFPASAQAAAQKLREIINAGDERLPLAYASLSRLSVLWTPRTPAPASAGAGQFGTVVNEFVAMMGELFPDEEGL